MVLVVGQLTATILFFESDEYQRHFMPYHPEYSIITNIDFDHPDYFKSIDDVFDAFNDYAKQVQKALFCMVMMLIFVKSRQMLTFTTMDSKIQMTLLLMILFAQQTVLFSK